MLTEPFHLLVGRVCRLWRSVCLGPLPIFYLGFVLWSPKSSLYLLDAGAQSDIFGNISGSTGPLLTFLIGSFDVQKYLILIKPSLSGFNLVAHVFGVLAKTPSPNPGLRRFYPHASSADLVVPALV